MSIFRKAYSVAGVVLMIQFFAQLYLVAAALLTIFQANDNAKDVYSAFKTADTFAGLHRANGDLLALTIIVMIGLGGYLTGRNWAFRRETAVGATTR